MVKEGIAPLAGDLSLLTAWREDSRGRGRANHGEGGAARGSPKVTQQEGGQSLPGS